MKYVFIIFAIALIAIFLIASSRVLIVQRYSLQSDTIKDSLNIILLTDLHSNSWHYDCDEIFNLIKNEFPDIVLIGGDLYDGKKNHQNVEPLLRKLGEEYPTYAVTGNHEYMKPKDDHVDNIETIEQELLKYNIRLLQDENLQMGDINLIGLNDRNVEYGDELLEKLQGLYNNNSYNLILCHKPEFFPEYLTSGADLACCGHTHGGQIRIPFILNGLFSTDQGLFPKYAGGLYEENGQYMIISRGMAVNNTVVPRIFNNPEIVVISVNK